MTAKEQSNLPLFSVPLATDVTINPASAVPSVRMAKYPLEVAVWAGADPDLRAVPATFAVRLANDLMGPSLAFLDFLHFSGEFTCC